MFFKIKVENLLNFDQMFQIALTKSTPKYKIGIEL